MRVISKKNTKRLVKGAVYEVLKIRNLKPNTKGYFSSYITIRINDNDLTFVVSNFTLEDGGIIPEINWESIDYTSNKDNINKTRINSDNPPKVGDYVKYIRNRNSHKNLEYNNTYRISDTREREVKYGNITRKVYDIKIEGCNRFYKSKSFRKCNTQEVREISLSDLFGEDNSVKKINTKSRKIDQYDNETKERILTKMLITSILDTNRNNMSVVDWTCKNGKIFSVNKDDFSQILTKSFASILENYK